MNTIPTTTKRLRVPYTVVGGARGVSGGKLPRSLTIALLNRGGRPFKASIFTELFELGASEIISVEGPTAQYDVENLARRFPEVRFLLLGENITIGERVNIAVEEAKGDYVFVIWNDLRIASGLSPRIIEAIAASKSMCTVGLFQNQKYETIPSIQIPALYKRHLRIMPVQPRAGGEVTICPFDFCGMYDKERFGLTGGYDYLLENAYWQKLDFGFRSFMWGERIVCNPALRLQYLREIPTEDSSHDSSYKLFFLKNLAVRFNRDVGRLPFGKFLRYLLRSGGDIVTTYREFREVARWVELNQFRFNQDARSVTELWERPE